MVGIHAHFGADPDPDPTPDPTPFFSDFKDAKKTFSFIFFLNLPAGSLQNLIFLLKFCVKILFCQHYVNQSAQHLYEKRQGSESARLTNGSGSGS
jgi:hypothetical protein